MSKTPFMPLWVSDFLGDTMDLDASEIGAYMLLLMAQWNRDGESLPNDSEKLKRICRCGRGWPKVWGVLERFFQTDENGIYSKRLRLEAASVAAKREVNAHNGALGGLSKALKSNNPKLANATISPERNASIPEPEPYKEDLGKPKSLAFSEFWACWPNKTGKVAAEKAWKALSHPDRISASENAAPWFDDWRKRHPDASPIHPATYLNKKRWTDEQQSAIPLNGGAYGPRPTARPGDGRGTVDAFAAVAARYAHPTQ